MNLALILTGREKVDLSQFAHIAVTNVGQYHELKASSHPSLIDFFQIDSTIDYGAIKNQIDTALHVESGVNYSLRWAPLALNRVSRQYLHYLQYRNRIESWLTNKKIGKLIVSSGEDCYLVMAAKAICENRGIELIVGVGTYMPNAGLEPYFFNEAISVNQKLFFTFIVYILGAALRVLRIRLLYEPYHNFKYKFQDVAQFRFCTSIFLKSGLQLISIFTRKPIFSKVMLEDLIIHSGPLRIKSNFWNSFTEFERQLISKSLDNFFKKYPPNFLDKITKRLKLYFNSSGIQRLIVIDAEAMHDRILINAAKEVGVTVDFLPHGLVLNHCLTSPNLSFSPNRVLAWNLPSAESFRMQGFECDSVVHQRINYLAENVRPHLVSLGDVKKILIFASPTSSLQPDATERDLIDVYYGLVNAGILDISVRFHPGSGIVRERQELVFSRVQSLIKSTVKICAGSIDSYMLMSNYNFLIIGGSTTAILEAAFLAIPFIIFRADINKISSLSEFGLLHADSSEELTNAILGFNFNKHKLICAKVVESFLAGKNPFECG
ncbi:hypothetical protein ICN35_08655 [Polynucleobacter sp. es-GGE-1]|uniref:hypothetical protein n=1 Tax=Polynucleobacter sp. es-GGE-1 TaxID=1819724 RepID=UPI001C0D712F|nr:hypothetical protein [Polynucleobacter sp. es-GGE-1]MBU3635528.1 hypothetical protein [Polynucleobacter sp. es-GGE-1]